MSYSVGANHFVFCFGFCFCRGGEWAWFNMVRCDDNINDVYSWLEGDSLTVHVGVIVCGEHNNWGRLSPDSFI